MLKIAEYGKKSLDLKNRVINAFNEAGLDYVDKEENNETIRLVFAGQYSAGKSSIIKMLTGREDIATGAGITTQSTRTYEWNGLEIIDTPGIHTNLRADHDEISYGAIASADMLVFVISNELFDSFIAKHFRKLAIDKDKAGEMVLVVNKMDRASRGNTPEQQDVIREDLRKVLEPYTPEQVNLCFISAGSYLKSVKKRNDDPKYADMLFSRSGYDAFIETLNRFVAQKSITAKLTTPLSLIEEQLEKAIQKLEIKSSDEAINALEEKCMQERSALFEVKNSLREEVKGIFTTAAAEIRNIGTDAANLLYEGCEQSEVEAKLEESVRTANGIIDECQQNAVSVIEERLNEAQRRIADIENSDFSRALESQLIGKFDTLPDNIKNLLNTAGTGMKSVGKTVAESAYKAGAQGGLKLSNFSGSTVHDIVLKAGHMIGYKFKPWQAVKITKGVAIGSKALSVFGVMFSVFMQIKGDKDEAKMREALKNSRQNIRGQFSKAADELEDHGRLFVKENVILALDPSIREYDDKISAIRATKTNISSACKAMEDLKNECRSLINEIHRS